MRAVRFMAPLLLAVQLPLQLNFVGLWIELIAYNAVALAALLSVLAAPRISNSWAQPLTAMAILSWGLGSIIATSSSYSESIVPLAKFSDALYLLFYPLALLGLQMLIAPTQKLTVLEIVDASIVGLGLSTLGAAFALHPVLPQFDGDMNLSLIHI